MTPKEYLRQADRISREIKRIEEELYRLDQDATHAGGIDYSKMRTQNHGTANSLFARKVERISELETELTEARKERTIVRIKIVGQINGMGKGEYSDLLYKRYIEKKSLETIAEEMGYAYGYIRRVHGLALRAFGDQYPDEISATED